MKQYASRLVALVLMLAVTMGATVGFGVPHYSYTVEEAADAPVMMTVNGEDVRKAEYAAAFAFSKSYMEGYLSMLGGDPSTLLTDPESLAILREMTDNQVVLTHVITQKVKELGIKLDRQTQRQIAESRAETIASHGGEESYELWLTIMNLTDRDYINNEVLMQYQNALLQKLYGPNGDMVPPEKELRKTFDDTYYKARHILLLNVDEAGKPLSDEQIAEKRARAEEALERVQAGEDFAMLMKEYSDDKSSGSSLPEGFAFTTKEMVPEFEKATADLEINAFSGLVETPYGIHIIQRLPLTDEDYEAFRPAVVKGSVDEQFEELLMRWCDEAEVSYADGHDKLTALEILA